MVKIKTFLEIKDDVDKNIISFMTCNTMVASIIHDSRVEPPWVVSVGSMNGWRNPSLRFKNKELATQEVLKALSLK